MCAFIKHADLISLRRWLQRRCTCASAHAQRLSLANDQSAASETEFHELFDLCDLQSASPTSLIYSCPWSQVRFVCIMTLGAVQVLCATLLLKRPNMMAFRVGGALESLQQQYFLLNLCFSMVTFDLQAQVQLRSLLGPRGGAPAGIPITTFPSFMMCVCVL